MYTIEEQSVFNTNIIIEEDDKRIPVLSIYTNFDKQNKLFSINIQPIASESIRLTHKDEIQAQISDWLTNVLNVKLDEYGFLYNIK